MSFLFLVALFLAWIVQPEATPEPATGLRLTGALLGVLVVASFAQWLGAWTNARLAYHVDRRPQVLKQYHWLRLVHDIVGLIVFGVTLHAVGWSSLVRHHWGFERWILVDELLLLAPYLAAEALSLVCFYFAEQNARQADPADSPPRRQWKLGTYLNYQLRHQIGIFLTGGLLMSLAKDVADLVYPHWEFASWASVVFPMLLSLGMLIGSPLLLRVVWGARVLPEGELRTHLERIARRIKFRYSNILVWDTGGVIANAAVTGVIPQLRYVLLSDALLEKMSAEEVAAVFGHEVGHIKHHHLSYYLVFVILSMVLWSLFDQWIRVLIQPWFEGDNLAWLAWVGSYIPFELVFLIPYVLVVFGMLSRRCERQADLFGTRTASLMWELSASAPPMGENAFEPAASGQSETSEPEPDSTPGAWPPKVNTFGARVFIQSLEKVATLNGIPLAGPNWRHGSIAERIGFLEQIATEPSLADGYDRLVKRFRWRLTAGLILGILALGYANREELTKEFRGEQPIVADIGPPI